MWVADSAHLLLNEFAPRRIVSVDRVVANDFNWGDNTQCLLERLREGGEGAQRNNILV